MGHIRDFGLCTVLYPSNAAVGFNDLEPIGPVSIAAAEHDSYDPLAICLGC